MICNRRLKFIMTIAICLLFCQNLWGIWGDIEMVEIPEIPRMDSEKVTGKISESIVRIIRYDDAMETEVGVGIIVNKRGDIVAPLRSVKEAGSVAIRYADGESGSLLAILAQDAVGNLARFTVTKSSKKRDFLEYDDIPPNIGEKVLLAQLLSDGQIGFGEIFSGRLREDPLYDNVISFIDSTGIAHSSGFLINHNAKVIGFLNHPGFAGESVLYGIPLKFILADERDYLTQSIITSESEKIPVSLYGELETAIFSVWRRDLAHASDELLNTTFGLGANALVLLYYGFCQMHEINYQDAIGSFKEALQLQADLPQGYCYQGLCLYFLGKTEEARQSLKKAFELYPRYLTARSYLGMMEYDEGNFGKGQGIFKETVWDNPDDPMAQTLLGRSLFFEGKLERARSCFQKAINRYQGYAITWIFIGDLYRASFFLSLNSMAMYEKAVEVAPDDDLAHFALGSAYMRTKHFPEAIEEFQKSIDVNPNFFGAVHNVALILHSNGQEDKAREFYEKALQLYPDHPILLTNLGVLYAKSGNHKDAIASFRHALRIEPEYYSALVNLGISSIEVGNYVEAEEALKKAIQMDDFEPRPYYQLGRLYIKMENEEEARRCYEKVKSMDWEMGTRLYDLMVARDSTQTGLVGADANDRYLKPLCHNLVYVFQIVKKTVFSSKLITFTDARNVPLGWGLMLNSKGDFIATAQDYKDVDDAVIGNNLISDYYDIDFKGIPSDSLDKDKSYAVKKVESAIIGYDYIIMSSKMPEDKFECPQFSTKIPRIDDSVIIIQDPIEGNPKILGGQIINIQTDPLLGEVLQIATPYELERSMGVVLNRDGKVAALIMSLRVPGKNYLFAFSAWKSGCFRESSGKSLGSITGELEKLGAEDQNLILGRLYLWLGDLDKAEKLFESALKANPKSSMACIFLGFCKLEKGEIDPAAENFETALKRDKSCLAAYIYLARCHFLQEQTDDAFECCKKAEKQNKKNPSPIFEMAEMHLVLGNKEAALKELEKLQKIDPLLAQRLRSSMPE